MGSSVYSDFRGAELDVVLPGGDIPFSIKYDYPNGDVVRAGGDAESLRYLSRALNFKFNPVPIIDGKWGGLVERETNAFNGMIGMVQRRVRNHTLTMASIIHFFIHTKC